MTETAGEFRPVEGGRRVVVLDALRGFAILGILLINVQLFRGPEVWVVSAGGQVLSGLDRHLDFLTSVFAEGKFYSIFSFLFGLGLVLQTARAEERGRPSGWFLARRLAVLAVFGLVHGLFVWSGDILFTYALLGFVFLLFRRRSARTMLVWGGVLISLPALLFTLLGGLLLLFALSPEGAEVLAGQQAAQEASVRQLADAAQQAYGSGSYADMFVQRLREIGLFAASSPFIAPGIFGMFLVGGAVVRAGWLEDLRSRRGVIRRVALLGLLIGLPLNVFTGYALAFNPGGATGTALLLLGQGTQLLAAPILALGYIGLATLLFLRYSDSGLTRRTAAVGRMALTNYLAQSIIMTAIFYVGDPGLYGRLSLAVSLLLCLVVYALQLVWSPLWLSRFRYGPVEWLWRRLTYGRQKIGAG